MVFKKGDVVKHLGSSDAGPIVGFKGKWPIVKWAGVGIEMEVHPLSIEIWEGQLPGRWCTTCGKAGCGGHVRRKRETMTYVVSKLSGKAIRMIARYAAMTQMGGQLTDSPDQFYYRYTAAEGCSLVEAERAFGLKTDELESEVRDTEGFLGSIYPIVEFVKGKLKDSFYLQQMVGDPPPAVVQHKRTPGTIKDLLAQLESCRDPKLAGRLRKKLRSLGHKGGRQKG